MPHATQRCTLSTTSPSAARDHGWLRPHVWCGTIERRKRTPRHPTSPRRNTSDSNLPWTNSSASRRRAYSCAHDRSPFEAQLLANMSVIRHELDLQHMWARGHNMKNVFNDFSQNLAKHAGRFLQSGNTKKAAGINAMASNKIPVGQRMYPTFGNLREPALCAVDEEAPETFEEQEDENRLPQWIGRHGEDRTRGDALGEDRTRGSVLGKDRTTATPPPDSGKTDPRVDRTTPLPMVSSSPPVQDGGPSIQAPTTAAAPLRNVDSENHSRGPCLLDRPDPKQRQGDQGIHHGLQDLLLPRAGRETPTHGRQAPLYVQARCHPIRRIPKEAKGQP